MSLTFTGNGFKGSKEEMRHVKRLFNAATSKHDLINRYCNLLNEALQNTKAEVPASMPVSPVQFSSQCSAGRY